MAARAAAPSWNLILEAIMVGIWDGIGDRDEN